MMDWIKDLCNECGGQCCKDFPMYILDFDGVHVAKNIMYTDINQGTLGIEQRRAFHRGCWFHIVGGCPGLLKPPQCQEWYCLWIEAIVFGTSLPDHWERHSKKLRLIHRAWIKEEPKK
jgi:hypothetical protein